MVHQKNPKRLTIALVLFAILIIIGLITIPERAPEYKLSIEESLEMTLADDMEINPETLIQNLSSDSGKIQCIDLRPPYEFVKGHIQNAINITPENLLEKEHLKMMKSHDENGMQLVLYSDNASSANGSLQLLKQMGIENICLMQGGFSTFQKLMNSDSICQKKLNNEMAWFDYNKLLAEPYELDLGKEAESIISVAPVKVSSAPKKVKKTKKVVVPVKVEEEEEEGGC